MAGADAGAELCRNRRVVLGITGSVAAYKAAILARALRRQGAEVRTILTAAAMQFVSPMLLEALTGEPAAAALFPDGTGRPVADHVAWAEWAEVGVIAPATADVLARLATGLADELLTAWALAFAGPLVVAPAMHSQMWAHPAVQRNVERLMADGVRIVPPAWGPLAAGEGEGWGRLAEPEAILAAVAAALGAAPPGPLTDRRVLITAGPTREHLDPVRFLSSPSSGRMGFALAEVAREMGARVTLVAGPTTLPAPRGVTVVPVVSAEQMQQAVREAAEGADAVIMAAAVSDWRPAEVSPSKLKKGAAGGELVLRLIPNPDILGDLGARKGRRVLVGFAAEAGEGPEEALRKLQAKGLDLIAYNNVQEPGAGFAVETNHVILLDRAGGREEIGPAPKVAVARRILERVVALLPPPLEQSSPGAQSAGADSVGRGGGP